MEMAAVKLEGSSSRLVPRSADSSKAGLYHSEQQEQWTPVCLLVPGHAASEAACSS